MEDQLENKKKDTFQFQVNQKNQENQSKSFLLAKNIKFNKLNQIKSNPKNRNPDL